MIRRYFITTGVIIIISLSSCSNDMLCIRGNGNEGTEYRRADSFTKIHNLTVIDVVCKKVDTAGIKIESDENLLDYIISETENNTLINRTHSGIDCPDFKTKPARSVTLPVLTSVFVSGSGKLIDDEMTGRDASVRLSGSGDVSIGKISGSDLTVALLGSGRI